MGEVRSRTAEIAITTSLPGLKHRYTLTGCPDFGASGSVFAAQC